jgi:hypothetical protein
MTQKLCVFERNNAVLKKPSSFFFHPEQTLYSSAFINALCLLKYVLNCEQTFFIFRSGLSDILINRNRISEGLVYWDLYKSVRRESRIYSG